MKSDVDIINIWKCTHLQIKISRMGFNRAWSNLFSYEISAYARFQYVHASLSRASFRLPVSGRSVLHSRLSFFLSVSPSFLSKNLPGWRRARCLPAHAVGDLGENRTINGIPRGINDCGAAFPAKFRIEDRTADRIYRVVATWTLPREDFSTFSDERE